MNPILLKPTGQRLQPGGRQRPRVEDDCRRASTTRTRARLRTIVLDAYDDLATRFDVIVIEGAGSVSELNLREHDLVNLGSSPHSARRGCSSPTSSAAACSVGRRHGRSAHGGRARAASAASRSTSSAAIGRSSTTACACSRQRPGRPASACFLMLDGLHLDAEDSLALVGTRPTHGGAAGRAHRHRQVPAALERDRLPAADVGGLDHVAAAQLVRRRRSCPVQKNTIADLAWLREDGAGGLGGARSIAAARPSSASAAATRCWAQRIDPTGVESWNPAGSATGSDCCR